MTAKEKKDFVLQKIEEGDTRSYNEFMADLELEIWHEHMTGFRPEPKVKAQPEPVLEEEEIG